MKRGYWFATVLAITLVVTVVTLVNGSIQSIYSSQTSFSVASPINVILQPGTQGNETFSTNDTNAQVVTPATSEPSTYDYVLEVVNQVGSNWTVYLSVYDSSNIGRLSNCTVSFHDGSPSNQIQISGGAITQSTGPQYALPGSSTIYISINNLQATSTGTSYLYVYLIILPSNMSPFNVLHITFQVT
jgi:hypothetical protein